MDNLDDHEYVALSSEDKNKSKSSEQIFVSLSLEVQEQLIVHVSYPYNKNIL